MSFRKRLNKKTSRRKFKAGAKVNSKNKPRTSRGGIRL
jgi:hypothetical protein